MPRALLTLALLPDRSTVERRAPRWIPHRPHILTEIGLPDSLSKPSLATRRHPCESVIPVWERESLWSQSRSLREKTESPLAVLAQAGRGRAQASPLPSLRSTRSKKIGSQFKV